MTALTDFAAALAEERNKLKEKANETIMESDSLKSFFKEAAKAKAQKKEELIERSVEVLPKLEDFFKAINGSTEPVADVVEAITAVVQSEAPTEPEIVAVESIVETIEEIVAAPDDDKPDDIIERLKSLEELYTKLKADIAVIKASVSKRTTTPVYTGGGGGEVNIRKMDDFDTTSELVDGASLVWDSTSKKFKPTLIENDSEMPYAKRVDFVSNNLLYKAEAAVGSADDHPVWRIHRIEIGVDGDVTEKWAYGSSAFVNQWTDRYIIDYE